MKGTLFSADFIEDQNGDFRLLEVNTDTNIPKSRLGYMNYSELIDVLSDNNITKFTVINKPNIHSDWVLHLSSSLNASASFIDTFTIINENFNTIYPASVTDSEDTFILRMAYDEAAIFDSEYAKGKLNLLKLFADNDDSGSVVEFYHSSSGEGFYDSITPSFNASNLPDVVVKPIAEAGTVTSFYKIGSEVEGESNDDRLNEFISVISDENNMIQKYHINPTSITDSVFSIRSFGIIYGSNLDLINLAEYKSDAIFSLPTGSIHSPVRYVNEIGKEHYYEFATNLVKNEFGFDGILGTHLVIKADDTEVEIQSLSVGDVLKSYQVSGWSSDETINYLNYYIDGDTLPSGSLLTTSSVIYKNEKALVNKTLINISVNNNEDSLFVAPQKTFLVYDSGSNLITWKTAQTIEPNNHFLIDYDGSKAEVTSNELYVTDEADLNLIEIDVEDTDTYIIAGTTPINSFVTHNAPCFTGDTKISLSNGDIKNIEDVVPGDEICTYDLEKNEIVFCQVVNVFSKLVNKIVHYQFDNGESLKCTIDHPIYVVGKGWCSFDNNESNSKYSLDKPVQSIEVGDIVKLQNGETKLLKVEVIEGDVKVYNLIDIEKNHNFFANNILVHNRFCFVAGTEVELENGEVKVIEDIQIGDLVLTYNESTNQQEVNKVSGVFSPNHNDLVKYYLSNGTTLTSTYDHPYYVNGLELASFSPSLTNERYKLEKEVIQIKEGDVVNLSDLSTSTIEKIEVIVNSELTKTYIITVENNHNFYANKVLVHNKCFVAGTDITLEDGTLKPIEEIKIGDKVLTFNEVMLINESGTVGDLKKHTVNETVVINCLCNKETRCTKEHPFFIIDKGWVNASDVKAGDFVKTINGKCEILSVEFKQGDIEVYNLLDVSNNHNFYANSILVHNKL